jgi:hypothetical protein
MSVLSTLTAPKATPNLCNDQHNRLTKQEENKETPNAIANP